MGSPSRSTPSTAIASSSLGEAPLCSAPRRPRRVAAIRMLDAILLFREALYGSLVIATVCSMLGVYVVLRRIVFVGAALAQLSTLGIALSFWLAGIGVAGFLTGQPLVLSLLATLAGVLFFGSGAGRARLPPDARIGVAYSVAAALAILFIAKAAAGE